jgi:hypothetical protein
MRIRDEVAKIKADTGRNPNNIEQFIHNKDRIIEVKLQFEESYGYIPKISECIYIIDNNLNEPPMCLHPGCSNRAVFHKKYAYCCRECSDTDPHRNTKIQQKRLPKVDYKAISKKVIETKNIVGNDGLNIHQRAGQKTKNTREKNYDAWYESVIKAQSSISCEVRKEASLKRASTIYERYNVTHFGGGYSKNKRLVINGKEFIYQGYEDVCLYHLVFDRGTDVNDIESCVRFDTHSFKYAYGVYYPDLYIISSKKYIEVKSLYWNEKDAFRDLKKQAVLDAGFNYERIIYGERREIERARKKLREANCYPQI